MLERACTAGGARVSSAIAGSLLSPCRSRRHLLSTELSTDNATTNNKNKTPHTHTLSPETGARAGASATATADACAPRCATRRAPLALLACLRRGRERRPQQWVSGFDKSAMSATIRAPCMQTIEASGAAVDNRKRKKRCMHPCALVLTWRSCCAKRPPAPRCSTICWPRSRVI